MHTCIACFAEMMYLYMNIREGVERRCGRRYNYKHIRRGKIFMITLYNRERCLHTGEYVTINISEGTIFMIWVYTCMQNEITQGSTDIHVGS